MKLLNCKDLDEIQKLLGSMDKQIHNLKQEMLKLVWYMRGGVTYSELMQLGSKEREIIGGIIKDNLETTKKSGLPFF